MRKREILIMTVMSVFLLAFSNGCSPGKEEKTLETNMESQNLLVDITYGLPKAGEAVIIDSIQEKLKENRGEATASTSVHNEVGNTLPAVRGSLRIATVGEPGRGILEAAIPLLRHQGYELEIIECEDYDSPNRLLLEGKAEANLFQHQAYLERYNQHHDTDLVSLGAIHYEPLRIYPGKCTSLQEVPKGARIGVPSNPTGYAQALLLLQQEGLLTLMEDTDLTAIWEDVTHNPLELELVQMEEEELVSSLTELDLAVCHGSYGLWKGILPSSALAVEEGTSLASIMLGQILVTTDLEEKESGQQQESDEGTGKESAEGIQEKVSEGETTERIEEMPEGLAVLMDVLRSEEMREYIHTQYRGSIMVLE